MKSKNRFFVLAMITGFSMTSQAFASDLTGLSVNCSGAKYGQVDAPYSLIQGSLTLVKKESPESKDSSEPKTDEAKKLIKQTYVAQGELDLAFGSFWIGGLQRAENTPAQGEVEVTIEDGVMTEMTIALQSEVLPGIATRSGKLGLILNNGPFSRIVTDGSKSYRADCSIQKI
jgi:hypothetical protein